MVAARAAAKASSEKAKTAVGGFMEFVRKQGVVGLAIGLAVGTQASELVKNIVTSIITPFVDLIVGSGGLKGLKYTLNILGRSGTFQFGLLIDSILKFIAVALVIYFVVIGLKLDKLDRAKE